MYNNRFLGNFVWIGLCWLWLLMVRVCIWVLVRIRKLEMLFLDKWRRRVVRILIRLLISKFILLEVKEFVMLIFYKIDLEDIICLWLCEGGWGVICGVFCWGCLILGLFLYKRKIFLYWLLWVVWIWNIVIFMIFVLYYIYEVIFESLI